MVKKEALDRLRCLVYDKVFSNLALILSTELTELRHREEPQ